MKNTSKKFNWMPVSDIMSGLMIVFLFISLSYMKLQKDQAAAYYEMQKEQAATYYRDKENLYTYLEEALRPLIEEKIISLNEETLAVTFTDEDTIYFKQNNHIIQPNFKAHLDKFIPIFIQVLQAWDQSNPNKIVEVRVEGHTSSVWTKKTSKEDSYYNNMQLSQDRSRAVVRYLMDYYTGTQTWDWLMEYVTANGLSSSRLIYKKGTSEEDKQKSMRVEFQIRLDSVELLKMLSKG